VVKSAGYNEVKLLFFLFSGVIGKLSTKGLYIENRKENLR
jgi:hypothetical protein